MSPNGPGEINVAQRCSCSVQETKCLRMPKGKSLSVTSARFVGPWTMDMDANGDEEKIISSDPGREWLRLLPPEIRWLVPGEHNMFSRNS